MNFGQLQLNQKENAVRVSIIAKGLWIFVGVCIVAQAHRNRFCIDQDYSQWEWNKKDKE